MTCIVGVTDGKSVFIGGDSAASDDDSIRVRKDEKVFRNGPMIIGCAGSFRVMQLLRYDLKIPTKTRGHSDFQYMATTFIKSIKECFLQDGVMSECNKSNLDSFFALVGYRGLLYCIENDFQVAMNSNGYESIGEGARFALGSLHTSYGIIDNTETRVLESLNAASCFSKSVRPPFIMMFNDGKSIKSLTSTCGDKWSK